MSLPVMKFNNNHQAADAVCQYLDGSRSIPEKFRERVFNQYSPDFSRWWLVPDSSWPAYKWGKLSFRQCPWESSAMYVGYYAEKGFDQSISKISGVKPNLVLQADWHWRRFLQDALHGELASAAEDVIRRSASPILLLVEAYEINAMPKPGVQEKADDVVRFEMESVAGGYKVLVPGSETLRSLNECTTLKGIVVRLEQQAQDLRFFWVDVHIGISVSYGSAETGIWDASDIWHNALAPWRPCIVG